MERPQKARLRSLFNQKQGEPSAKPLAPSLKTWRTNVRQILLWIVGEGGEQENDFLIAKTSRYLKRDLR